MRTYARFKPTNEYREGFYNHLLSLGLDEGNAELIAGNLNRNLQYDLYSRISDIIALYCMDHEGIPPSRNFWRLYYHSLREWEDPNYKVPVIVEISDLPVTYGAQNVSV